MAKSRLLLCANFCSLFSRSFSFSHIVQARGRGRSKGRSAYKAANFDIQDEVDYEAVEDFLSEHGTRSANVRKASDEMLMRDFRRQQARLRQQILEKKYFKKPLETNLLTWEAKEQIRYLNREFPEEWTPEALAETFPVSSEGVINILKGSYKPRTEEEVVKHNCRVVAHWKELRNLLSAGGHTSDAAKFSHVLDSGKLPLMKNADGATHLPVPIKSEQKDHKQLQQGRTVGIFESIVARSSTGGLQGQMVKGEQGRVVTEKRQFKYGQYIETQSKMEEKNVKLLTEIASAGKTTRR